MGRYKKENKKQKISITLEKEVLQFIEENSNKSKSDFVNFILINHFKGLKKG